MVMEIFCSNGVMVYTESESQLFDYFLINSEEFPQQGRVTELRSVVLMECSV